MSGSWPSGRQSPAPTHPHFRLVIPTGLDIGPEDRELIGEIFLVAAKLARENGIAADGYRVVLNTNSGAGQ
jgi:histidine triad (HIT) family protein